MSIKITGKYLGAKHVEMRHEPSAAIIATDAPKDNHGLGSCFSPTDLCAASLATCMLTVMGIRAEKKGYSLLNSHFTAIKHMQTNPRRIGQIEIEIHLPSSLPVAARSELEAVAHSCPVHHSLHPEIKVDCEFIYDVAEG